MFQQHLFSLTGRMFNYLNILKVDLQGEMKEKEGKGEERKRKNERGKWGER